MGRWRVPGGRNLTSSGDEIADERLVEERAAPPADELRRLQASAGNASIARALASSPEMSGACTRGARMTSAELAVTIPFGGASALLAGVAASRAGDAMPGGEHGIDPAELVELPPERPAGPTAEEPAPEEPAAGTPIRLPDIRSPQIQRAGTTDGLSTWLGYSGTIRNARGGLPPAEDEFGVTWWSEIDVTNITAFKLPLFGGFMVKATIEHRITWEVRDGQGPTGQVDVKSPADPALTASNYERVAEDLTPRTDDLNGRPPREQWWSRSLTEQHEQFHANEARELGEEGVAVAAEWLGKQSASTVKDVENLLWDARRHVLTYVSRNTTFPANEERAYGDGAGAYRALAEAIRETGRRGGYR